jgi:2-iminobutanoate/2-iminopropanoate deaminase
MNAKHDIGVAARIGTYSDAIEVSPDSRWLLASGTPGLSVDGVLPEDFASQAVLAWENVIRMLHSADMSIQDIVKITQYLVRRSDLDAYRPIRSRFLGDAKPASMLSFASELVWPVMLIELEIVAARPR